MLARKGFDPAKGLTKGNSPSTKSPKAFLSLPWFNAQSNFPSMAILHLLALRIPKPPLNLLFVIWCQPTRCTLPFSSVRRTPEKISIHPIQFITNLLREEGSLHCIHRQSKCCRLNKCLPSRLTNYSFQPLALSLRNLHKFSEKPFHELVARQDTSPSSL